VRLRPWTVRSRTTLFETPYGMGVHREVVELPDGRTIDDYYQVTATDAAIVAALTGDGCFVLLRQYLHGPRRVGLSLPGGQIEAGEPPLRAAQRELREETGYAGPDWRSLGTLTRNANQGGGTEHLFLAHGVARVGVPVPHDLEEQEIVLLEPDAVRSALRDGAVPVVVHVALLAMALLGL